MLKVCDPCLIVITRWPRRPSSAVRRTASVVLPLCFLPMTATIGGRDMLLREGKIAGRVDVHEHDGRIAVPRDLGGWKPHEADILVERDHAAVARREPALDRRDAGRRIIRAER